MTSSIGSGSQRDLTFRSWKLNASAMGSGCSSAASFSFKLVPSDRIIRIVSSQAEHFTDALRNTVEHVQRLENRFASAACSLSLATLCDLRLLSDRILSDRRLMPIQLGAGRQKLHQMGEALYVSAISLPKHQPRTVTDTAGNTFFELDSFSEFDRWTSSSSTSSSTASTLISPQWFTLLDILRPDGNEHTTQELTEEFAWRLVVALIGTLAFAHAQGLHYHGALACKDVIVRRHQESNITEVGVAPPFSLFSGTESDESSLLAGQAGDVLAAGQIIASLLTSSHFLPNKLQSSSTPLTSQLAPFSSVSTDLSLLVRRMIVTSAEQRPSAAQFLEFQAVILRVRSQLMSNVAFAGKQELLAHHRELENRCETLHGQVKAFAAVSSQPPSEREALLQSREHKLASFLELYELTATTLDGMHINGQSVSALKAMLGGAQRAASDASPRQGGVNTTTVPSSHRPVPLTASPTTLLHAMSPGPHQPLGVAAAAPRSGSFPREENDYYIHSVEERLRPVIGGIQSNASTPPRPTSRPSSALAWNMDAPPAPQLMPDVPPSPLPKIEMSVDNGTPPHMIHRGHLTPPQQSPPVPPPFRSPHHAPLNDSIEVIVLDDEDPSSDVAAHFVASAASVGSHHTTMSRRRTHRQRHNGGGFSTDVGSGGGGDAGVEDAPGGGDRGSTAWRDHHFAELDNMQQELHRSSRTTPTKELNSGSLLQQKFNQAAARRSPSAGNRVGSRSRSSGASNHSLDRDEDPVAVLQRLRAAF
ncbi:Hypothetical protein, putative [Bodo saltans]|uniref:Protein kinase domain-containing protein n=1 Tax=Bodo saltans TaxID=75058 RepID=A0A0S4IWL6_BODSA|nr:Hypothetical protein, putative [Bodo saltans]|eukprot:CUG30641.1 Hypothetical protein, putative [Bodo saltans]